MPIFNRLLVVLLLAAPTIGFAQEETGFWNRVKGKVSELRKEKEDIPVLSNEDIIVVEPEEANEPTKPKKVDKPVQPDIQVLVSSLVQSYEKSIAENQALREEINRIRSCVSK